MYAETRNATQAAIKAGYARSGARQEGARLLTNADILAAYDAYMRPRLEQHGINANRVLQHLADIAFAPWGNFVAINDKQTQVKLGDKLQALITLAHILGLFRAKDKQDDKPNLNTYYQPGMSSKEAQQQLLALLRQR